MSGFVVISFSLVPFRSFVSFFVEERFGDNVLFRSPIAQVQKAAALAAERKIGVGGRIYGLAADGAGELHCDTPLSIRFASTLFDTRLKKDARPGCARA
jgi:hypothetical protein